MVRQMVRQIKRKMDTRALNEARRKELHAARDAALDADDLVEAKRLKGEIVKLAPKGGQRSFSSKSECEDPFSQHLIDHYSRPTKEGNTRTSIDWLREFQKEVRADIGHHGLVPGVAAIVDRVSANDEFFSDETFKAIVRAVSIKIADRIQAIGMLYCERLNQAIRMMHGLGPDVAKALGLPPVLPRFDAEKQDVWVRRNVKSAADYEEIFEEGWAKYLAQLEPVTAEGEAVAAQPTPEGGDEAAQPPETVGPEPEPADTGELGVQPDPEPADTGEPEDDDTGEPEPVAMPANHRAIAMSDMLEDA